MGSWQHLNQKEGIRINLLQDLGHVRWFFGGVYDFGVKQSEVFLCTGHYQKVKIIQGVGFYLSLCYDVIKSTMDHGI